MHPLYTVLYGAAHVFLLPFEYKKRPKDVRGRWLAEKLGDFKLRQSAGPAIWLHAVSVGETVASVPFLRALKQKRPDLQVIVSTITDTGQAVARQRLGDIARIIYLPLDVPSALNRAIRSLRPNIFVVMETEIWPNLFRCMKRAGVPVAMLNGRISEKSFKGYLKIRPIVKKVLEDVDVFLMQDNAYASRIISLGAEEEKVINTGSLKYDIQVKREEMDWLKYLGSPVVVVGSTHQGEDVHIVRMFMGLREEFPRLTMVLAPRHPERFDDVEALIRAEGAPCVRRSRLSEAQRGEGAVILLDTVGELSTVYRAADVAVMGGSFVRHGGQNPLEPAAWGKPVVCGPHMWNFPFIEEFYREGAAAKADESSLEESVRELLLSPEKAVEIGRRAKDLIDRNRGAVERAVYRVLELLGE
jgi:3-deoxy-D-manno-octulosonic-acid transferase